MVSDYKKMTEIILILLWTWFMNEEEYSRIAFPHSWQKECETRKKHLSSETYISIVKKSEILLWSLKYHTLNYTLKQ